MDGRGWARYGWRTATTTAMATASDLGGSDVMHPTLSQHLAPRRVMVAIIGVLMLAFAIIAIGALASSVGESAPPAGRPAESEQGDAPAEAGEVPLQLRSGAVVVSPADATPQRRYAEWEINEMQARHPEP